MFRIILSLTLIIICSFLSQTAFAGKDTAKASSKKYIIKDYSNISKAVSAAKNGNWKDARKFAHRTGDPTVNKIILWMEYVDTNEAESFKEISEFITRNPHWPNQEDLWNTAEKIIINSAPPHVVVEWFKTREPETRYGMIALAEALKQLYGSDPEHSFQAERLIKQTWVKANFTDRNEERGFYNKYKKYIGTREMAGRISRLLWEGDLNEARRHMHNINDEYRALFDARIDLMRGKSSALRSVKKVPKELLSDPGLLFELVKWYDSNEDTKNVVDILATIPAQNEYQERWWSLRSAEIRMLIEDRQFKNAYLIASNHGMKEGSDYADAEWLAGWVALRYIKDPETAYKHFYKLYHNVKTSISLSRASYWAGRAAQTAGKREIADSWYNAAAVYQTTFYGQLAATRMGKKKIVFPAPPVPSKEDNTLFDSNELVRAFRIFAGIQEYDYARKFLVAAVESAKTAGELQLLGKLCISMGRKDFAILAAKNAITRGVLLEEMGYPVVPGYSDKKGAIEPALTHAIIRQESVFNKEAVSSAGALGMMQLLPDTARMVAKRIKTTYSKNRLTSDANYNIRLGSSYLGSLIDNYEGSYILAIASYNAGSGNVRKWIDRFGNPRQLKKEEDVVDWLEMIPFKETRNYVQRVTEALQVYRYRLAKQSSPSKNKQITDIKIDKDIMR